MPGRGETTVPEGVRKCVPRKPVGTETQGIPKAEDGNRARVQYITKIKKKEEEVQEEEANTAMTTSKTLLVTF